MSNTILRREFLRWGLGGVSVGGAWPLFLGRTAAAAVEQGQRDDERVLVVVQLTGGNDGLSTVVPYSDPAYRAARQSTWIDEQSVLRIDERVGLHPNLRELKQVFDEGQMAIVQGVSYPNPTRSHFEAMDIWHAGDLAGARRGSGWLGRALDQTAGGDEPTAAISVGDKTPLALVGEKVRPVVFETADRYQWRGRQSQQKAYQALNEGMSPRRGAEGRGELDFVLRVAQGADESSAAIRQAVGDYRSKVDYPDNGNRLASGLRSIAAMIAGGLPTRVYYAALGGFDTHANQSASYGNLMRSLSGALGAFLGDLRAQRLLDRVLVLCFSEFGRRVRENGSRGTDHGVAAPVLLLGSGIRGGLHGAHPSLTELVKGDLAMSVDFRQVYATVLDGWLGAGAERVLGQPREALPLLAAAG